VGGATNSGVEAVAKILGCKAQDLLCENKDQKLRIYDAENPTSWPDWVHQKRADKIRRFKEIDLKVIDKE
jgi:hypothetical protein